MITRIREVRRAKNMTLLEVAEACVPPTTAQTIGRLETGTRTVSVGWLNRIAAALGVTAGDLVELPNTVDLHVVATIDGEGAHAPHHDAVMTVPAPSSDAMALTIAVSIGEYRAGDVVWCDRVEPADYATMLNRDVLLPRPGGRFIFGRLIGRTGNQLLVLPPEAGSRQQVVSDPEWAAVATTLVRSL